MHIEYYQYGKIQDFYYFKLTFNMNRLIINIEHRIPHLMSTVGICGILGTKIYKMCYFTRLIMNTNID